MDNQHSILMEAMNDLRLAVMHGSRGEEVNVLLDRTVAFTRLHFESEERLMERTAFPGMAEHSAAHQKMLMEIHESVDRLRSGEGVNVTAMLCLLQGGYTDHIGFLDQAYRFWFHEHGIY